MDVNDDGTFSITYETTDKLMTPRKEITLVVKYGGSADLTTGEADCTISLIPKPVTAQVQGEITKVYDGDTDANVAFGFAEGEILGSDQVDVSAPNAAYASAEAGEQIAVTLGSLAVGGDQKDFYDVSAPADPIYGSITRSGGSTLETTVKNGEVETKDFTYGDTMTIVVTPKPSNTPSANQVLLADDMPAMELFYGEVNLNAEIQEADGAYTLTYHTAEKELPISETGLTLTVKFHGDSNMGSGEAVIEGVTLAKKSVSAVVDGTVTKPYDQNTDVTVSFKVEENLVGEDTVTGTATGVFEDENAGDNKPVTVDAGDVVWNEISQWYDITLPTGITGAIEQAKITGGLTISGTPEFGAELKAEYDSVSGESVSFTWKRGDKEIGHDKTYTPTKEDVGQEITVTVTATDGNHEGSVTSAPVVVEKADQEAPGKPVIKEDSVGTSGFEVEAMDANPVSGAAVEFSIDDGQNWQTETKFEKLNSGTEYSVIARYQETDAYHASPASEPTTITTDRHSSPTSYGVSHPGQVKGGSIKVTPTRASRGDTVTITVTPDEGWELDTLSVTQTGGRKVDLTDKGNGKYTFIMPGSKVEIEVMFKEVEPEALPFADVPEDAWYAGAVRYVYENGLMAGTSGDAFNPDGTTTRSQFVTILWRMADSPAVDYQMNFSDVPADIYYTEAVRWAASEGIVGGYGNGSFGSVDAISREQLAVFLFRFAERMGYDVSQRADLTGYTDLSQVNSYAQEAMEWAVGAGIISGTSSTTLSPQGQATRAQAAAMLERFCQKYAENQA